jgi:hypothetical protein
MKAFSKVLLVLLLLSTAFSGCKKDEEDIETSGYFEVNGETYELNSGMLEHFGEDDWYDGYNVDMTLFSPGLTVNNSIVPFVEGEGDALVFEMISEQKGTLAEGVYEFIEFEDEGVIPAESFYFGGYVLGAVAETQGVDVEQFFMEGTVTVKKSGKIYTIDIDCTDFFGNKLTGHIKGPLKYYDYSEDSWEAQSLKDSGKRSDLR